MFRHSYTNSNFQTITVNTEDMEKFGLSTEFGLSTGYFRELRIGKCPELIWLDCDYAALTVLEISDVPKLTGLYCSWSFLGANAINDLFKSLPIRQKSENAVIKISLDDFEHCDRTIAEKKMWTVRY